MTPQQMLGVVLIVAAIGLVVWSMWPAKKTETQREPQSPDADIDEAGQWGEVHALIAKLSFMLDANPSAKAKLDEVGAALYVDSNWVRDDEPSE